MHSQQLAFCLPNDPKPMQYLTRGCLWARRFLARWWVCWRVFIRLGERHVWSLWSRCAPQVRDVAYCYLLPTELNLVLRLREPTKAGWQALQELHGPLLSSTTTTERSKALGRFCDLYQTGELPEFHNIVDTILTWSDEIFAWHHTNHPSNGRIEGINNLLQILRRTAHGFTNPTNFQTRAILIT